MKIVGIVSDVLRIEIAVRYVGIDSIVVVGGERAAGFIVESLAQHVDKDGVLPVA